MHGLQLLLRAARTQQHHQQRELGTPDLQDSGVVASLSNVLRATAGPLGSVLLPCLAAAAVTPAPANQQQPVQQGTAAPPCLPPQ